MSRRSTYIFLLLFVSSLFPLSHSRRGGGGGFGRGSSGARTGGGGGLFGGGSKSGGSRTGGSGGGLFGGGASRNQGGSGGLFGGGGGNNMNMGRKQGGQGWGQNNNWNQRAQNSRSGYYGGGMMGRPRYSKSGIGSFGRSNQFKNAIVGAAAGYLTYQAGKAIIRSIAAPMMWNNRPYYWGQSYYQPRHGNTNMCRMPMEENDQQFGNIYSPGGMSRPKEIVWGCSAYEYCCGYECCRGGSATQGYGLSVGYAFVVIHAIRAYLL